MKRLVFLENQIGEIRCAEPSLHLGQKFGKEEAENFMIQLNKNIKEGFKYIEVIKIVEHDNFYNFSSKKKFINSVIEEIKNKKGEQTNGTENE